MLNENDVFALQFDLLNKAFKNVISGSRFRPRFNGIFQVVKITPKSYHVKPLFTRTPLAEVKHRTLPRKDVDLLLSHDGLMQFVHVIPPEEFAKMLLIN